MEALQLLQYMLTKSWRLRGNFWAALATAWVSQGGQLSVTVHARHSCGAHQQAPLLEAAQQPYSSNVGDFGSEGPRQ